MLVHRKPSRQKAQSRKGQNLLMLFSTLHYLRMKAIKNQRDAILSLLSVSKRKRRNDVVKEIWKMGRRKSAETFEEILNMASLVLSFSVEFTHAVQHHSAMSTCISQ